MKPTHHRHNDKGEEVLNPTPMQPPLGYRRAPTLTEQIRHQVLAAKLDALAELEETEDEADDFEIGDDYEPLSPHENDHIPTIKKLREKADEINNEIQRLKMEALRDRLKQELETKSGREAPASPSSSSETLT